jgi:zinc protease
VAAIRASPHPGPPAERTRRARRLAGARVTEARLAGGLQVLVAARAGDPVVATHLLYRVGSRDEDERQAGVAHFLEHMMFKGSRRFGKGAIDRLTTELGGSNNAFTSNDSTGYWFELASDRWETALDVELDRMRGLLLDERDFEAEREVVLEELAMGEDDPWRVLGRRVEAALFPRHAYGRPIIGWRETLESLTVAEMRAFHAAWYRPENAVLVIAGAVDARSALAAAARRFERGDGGRPPARAPRRPPRRPWCGAIEEPAGETRLSMRWDDPARRLCMAWPTVSMGTADDWALDVVATLLGVGRLAPLQRRLVYDERLAVSLSLSNDTRALGGAFWLQAELAPGVEPPRLEAAIDEELARFAAGGPSPGELERARGLLRSSQAFELETVSDLVEIVGEYGADADWRLALREVAERLAVDAGRAAEAARRLLTRERRVTGWCLPRPDRASVQVSRPADRADGETA